MLFKFSQIKFLSHILLGMATVSALVGSPFAAVKVLANDAEQCKERSETELFQRFPLLQRTIVRIEMKKTFCPKNQGSCNQERTIDNGSGTIIAKNRGIEKQYKYTVLTADHNFSNQTTPDRFANTPVEREGSIVGEEQRKIKLITYDNQLYELKKENVIRFRNDPIHGLDLAVVTFESDVEYPFATLAPLPEGVSYEERITQSVTVVGWPAKCVQENRPFLWHDLGAINPHEDYDYQGIRGSEDDRKPTIQGYVMGYNATTATGVSGGPVFDEEGHLIGVHGLALGERIRLSPGLSEELKSTWANVPGGIPINTFTDQLPGSNQRLENRNSLFDHLSTNLMNFTIEASLPPSLESNENLANNSSQSVDTYFEQAAQYWKNALAASNNSPGAGCVAECREEAEKALAQYDEALKIINNEPSRVRARALVFRGIVHQLLGNSSKKESDWEQASQIVQAGGEPLAYVWLGNTLYRWGYTQKAEELWDQAVNIANSDDNADVYLEIGKFLIENGRRAEGREYWNRLINRLPENSVIRRKIAAEYAYFAKPHLGYDDFAYGEAALEQAQEAVNINPNAYSYYDLARIQADLGDPESAKATLEQAANNCGESICGTLIEDKRQEIGVASEQEENQDIEIGFSSSDSTPASDNFVTPPTEDDFVTPPTESKPEEIATGPTYFCNDANRQTMRRTQPLINWESREFGWQYQPDNRCTYVSNRLESYETQGLLTQVARITHGVMNGYRVLCIATDETAANARNCIGGQLVVTLGSIDRSSIQEAEAALAEFKAALRDSNYVGPPLDNIKGVKGVSKPK